MYHIGFLVVCVWIFLFPAQDISNVPLAQLTLSMIGDKLLSVAKLVLGMWMLFRSVERDKIWPWRWDRFFVGDLLSALFVWGVVLWLGFGATKNQEITILVAIALGGLAYAYILHKGPIQNAAKEQALKLVTFDRSGLSSDFDEHAAKTCIAIYVDEKFEQTQRPPEGTCYVSTGDGSIEVNFPKLGLLHVLRECLV